MKRTAAREIAIQLGFSVSSTGGDPKDAVEAFFDPAHYASMKGEGELYIQDPSESDIAFITQSVVGVSEHKEEIDGYIGKYAKGWRTERISRSAAAIMRQAIFEMLYLDDIPAAASINEAVELAKGYEDESVVSFINGVLGGFWRGEISVSEDEPETLSEEEQE